MQKLRREIQKLGENLVPTLLLVIMIGLVAILVADLLPIFHKVMINANHEEEMAGYIASYGAKGMPIIVSLQVLQVITAFFPGAAIQLLAGLCYGMWLGMLLCLLGYIIGNALVFSIVRQAGRLFLPLTERFGKKKGKLSKYFDFLLSARHPEWMAFFFFLIPGIPNGILPYLFAKTNISLKRYLGSIASASAPSILVCTLTGSLLANRQWVTAGILWLCFSILILILFLFRERIVAMIENQD